jgi:hypothetical protein
VKEIVVHFPQGFPEGIEGIRLISYTELRRHFMERGEAVPPWWVNAPYVEVGGERYAVAPIVGRDESD